MEHKKEILKKIEERFQKSYETENHWRDMYKLGHLSREGFFSRKSREQDERMFLHSLTRMMEIDRKCDQCKKNLAEYPQNEGYLCNDCYNHYWHDPA